ncbi:hypothetical protein RDWZM_008129 [Blomia tropicalis]|uniref:Uncharacterized protein n=1 Tax=Blomia tropicalis TaxID=40697 RepID=A0A9Q0M2Z1_BLOTA|nr:hypothetical protein BLOT_003841 [Blomia tropicalis]KAJ6216972.1 hypothetical protein RDWZM_008129 [Blomia tropicalis]
MAKSSIGSNSRNQSQNTDDLVPEIDVLLNYEINGLNKQLEAELGVSTAFMSCKKELPLDSLKALRTIADNLKDDEWLYPSVNKLLGLQ